MWVFGGYDVFGDGVGCWEIGGLVVIGDYVDYEEYQQEYGCQGVVVEVVEVFGQLGGDEDYCQVVVDCVD